MERALDAITKARAGQLQPRFKGLSPDKQRTTTAPAQHDATQHDGESNDRPPVETETYRCFAASGRRASDQFYTQPIGTLAALVADIVQFEGPIHPWVLARRTAGHYGLERVGDKIQGRVDLAVSSLQRSGQLVEREGFLWPTGLHEPILRRRDDDPSKDIDMVCLEELALAAMRLSVAQFGMDRADLITQTARLLGFRAVTAKVKSRVETAIQKVIESGGLEEDASGSLRSASDRR